VGFSPYFPRYPCEDPSDPSDNLPVNWSYDVSYGDGFVRVLGENPGPDPVDAGIRFVLGDVEGQPGEVVEVPVFASTEEPLATLQLALELDPALVTVESLDYRVLSFLTGEHLWERLDPGAAVFFRHCDDPDAPPSEQHCEGGIPGMASFLALEDRYIFAEFVIQGGQTDFDYPGLSLTEIARLRLRIADDPPAPRTVVRPAAVPWSDGAFVVERECGGYLAPEGEVLAGASEVRPATITIHGVADEEFVRGDANADGNVDLSDAVATLNYLFLGGEDPSCFDAADADDSGDLSITDAILHLGVLFLGAGSLPPPYPECGPDPTADGLDCLIGCLEN
jgi:hypothetical protein